MCQCGGAAEHEHGVDEGALASNMCSLHQYIDMSKCQALNAQRGYELGHILRARFVDRKDAVLESDADQQLIVKIQYESVLSMV